MSNELGNKFGRPDLDRIGIFSEAPYISTGDKFNEKNSGAFLAERTKGKQFITNPGKLYFNKEFARVFENEPSGKGSPFGTFDQQWPIQRKNSEGIPSFTALREQPKHERQKTNFLTSPPKRGTGYGYANVTIGKSPEYTGDPYNAADVASKKTHEDHKRRVVGERPFVTSSSNMEFFTPFVSLAKDGAGAGKDVKPTSAKRASKQGTTQQPFKPSSGPGYTINKYPSAEEGKNGKAGGEDAVRPPRGPALIFRCAGAPRTYPIRSIIESNIPIAPPLWIRQEAAAACKT
ncbi:hypothetical protein HKX48_004873 [Thoreauomyces humboldtii]|nr:hypothetical protein HKX48_004873 [Thoreauomyces humboldtii]